ncbi:MAG: glycosyltransferase family 4 protein [Clostridiales bacterium]|jgi:glycosyltransferase involved in cell wall biosynthesis|nr:glycosyltransferase family 4 protein [Clostridiales bacterium]
MKIGIDLRPFSTASKFRGIGSYARNFIKHIYAVMKDVEFHFLDLYGADYEMPGSQRCYYYYYCGPTINKNGGERQLLIDERIKTVTEAQVRHFIRHSQIDVMFIPSPVEYGNPFEYAWFDGVATVTIFYDAIPLQFPKQYLYDPVYSKDYYDSIEYVKKFDLLLTISEAVCADGKMFFNFTEKRIKTIGSGLDPQFRKLSVVDSKVLKDRLGISDNFLLYVGGSDFRKNTDKLVDAYMLLDSATKSRYQLVIVSVMSQHYLDMLNGKIAANDNTGRVVFVNRVTDDDLVRLYNITDLFVFPSLYEGFGLPIIEAMACGARVVTSNCSSLLEVAEGYATLVNPKSARSIAKGILSVLNNPVDSLNLADKAVEYAKSFTWDIVAERAKVAIDELVKSKPRTETLPDRFSVDESMLKNISAVFAENNIIATKEIFDLIAEQLYYIERDLPLPIKSNAVLKQNDVNDTPRILYDMTVCNEWFRTGYITGIGRVSKELFKELDKIANVVPIAFVKTDGEWTCKRVDKGSYLITNSVIEPKNSDIYIMPELQLRGMLVPKDFPTRQKLREKGVRCYSFIYDILPITLPQYFEKGTVCSFPTYVNEQLQYSDGILCDSRTVCDDIIKYCDKKKLLTSGVKYGFVYPSVGLPNSIDLTKISVYMLQFFNTLDDIFLAVGTIEPRKGYTTILEAFEKLWQRGGNAKLCIIGRVGWNMGKFVDKLKSHKENGARLGFFEGACDDELCFAYQNSTALIQSSAGEGYGMPIIEAAVFGLPVICSDIPVFHEVAGEHALYFDRTSSDNLMEKIRLFTSNSRSQVSGLSNRKTVTWLDSAQSLYNMTVLDKGWYMPIRVEENL